jgi:hypothetical protein
MMQLLKMPCKKAFVVFTVRAFAHLAETSNPVDSPPAEQ